MGIGYRRRTNTHLECQGNEKKDELVGSPSYEYHVPECYSHRPSGHTWSRSKDERWYLSLFFTSNAIHMRAKSAVKSSSLYNVELTSNSSNCLSVPSRTLRFGRAYARPRTL